MADAAGCFLGACLRICFSLTPSFGSRVGKIGDLWSRLRWLKSTENPSFQLEVQEIDKKSQWKCCLPSSLPPPPFFTPSFLPFFSQPYPQSSLKPCCGAVAVNGACLSVQSQGAVPLLHKEDCHAGYIYFPCIFSHHLAPECSINGAV